MPARALDHAPIIGTSAVRAPTAHQLERLGTFSKVLLPTLRVGFVVAPPALSRGSRPCWARLFTTWSAYQSSTCGVIGFGACSALNIIASDSWEERPRSIASNVPSP